MHTRVLRLALSGLMGALLVVSKQAMSGLPNIEPVTMHAMRMARLMKVKRNRRFTRPRDTYTQYPTIDRLVTNAAKANNCMMGVAAIHRSPSMICTTGSASAMRTEMVDRRVLLKTAAGLAVAASLGGAGGVVGRPQPEATRRPVSMIDRAIMTAA